MSHRSACSRVANGHGPLPAALRGMLLLLVLPIVGLAGCDANAVGAADSAPAALVLDAEIVELAGGDTTRIVAVLLDARGNPVAPPEAGWFGGKGQDVVWSSSDPSITSVSEAGVVAARSAGRATITASIGKLLAKAIVRVRPGVRTVEIEPKVDTLYAAGSSLRLRASVRDGYGRPVPAPDLYWTSLDTTLATVNNKGRVTMAGIGVAAIVATAGGVSDTSHIVLLDGSGHESSALPHAVLTLRTDLPGRAVNRRVLGNNVEWVYGGNQMLLPGTNQFDPAMLQLATELSPTVLRYPGGSQGDFYHWRDGMGPLSQRGENENFFTGERQRVEFGTAEFLTLSRHVGAEALITVNAMTGTAEEAAGWVHATNVARVRAADGTLLPRVRFWEIDNEPYLTPDGRPELHITPSEYARRANRFIRAMRDVDPSIAIGIPIRSDRLGISPLPPLTTGFADVVLSSVSERFDFVALHNAYFPFIWDQAPQHSDLDVFRATMAASHVVEDDLRNVRSLLRRHRPGQQVGIAITEYNAMFSFDGPRAEYISTLGGALYVADVLRVFATADDVIMANFWGLADNWHFGAFSRQHATSSYPQPRPAYQVFQAYDRVLRGQLLSAEIESPEFETAQVGFVPAARGLPTVTSIATREGDRIRILVLNKDPSGPVRLTLRGPEQPVSGVEVRELTDAAIFNVGAARQPLAWRPRPDAAQRLPFDLELQPHSLTWIEMQLRSN